MNKNYAVIGPEHVNQWAFTAFGMTCPVSSFMGRIMRQDIGKRVYRVPTNDGKSFIFQVENDEQFAKRMGWDGPACMLFYPLLNEIDRKKEMYPGTNVVHLEITMRTYTETDGRAIADWLLETFNDDDSIEGIAILEVEGFRHGKS